MRKHLTVPIKASFLKGNNAYTHQAKKSLAAKSQRTSSGDSKQRSPDGA